MILPVPVHCFSIPFECPHPYFCLNLRHIMVMSLIDCEMPEKFQRPRVHHWSLWLNNWFKVPYIESIGIFILLDKNNFHINGLINIVNTPIVFFFSLIP